LWTRLQELSQTERNWLWAVLMMIGSVALFAAAYLTEMNLGRWRADIRLVRHPAEAAMRYLGISHFLVALFFTVTSKRMRTAAPWMGFVGLVGLAGVLCVGYGQLRLVSPPLASILFIGYFMVHDLRDQVFFYFSNEGIPSSSDTEKALAGAILWIPFVAIGGIAAAVAAAVVLGAPGSKEIEPFLPAVPSHLRWTVVVVPTLLLLAAAGRLRYHWARAGLGRFDGFLRTHRPILVVIAGTFVVLIVGYLLRWSSFGIVILHVTGWYVFSMKRLAGTKGPTPVRASTWLRGTRAGFNLLHVGSAALLVLVGAIWAYRFRNDEGLTVLWALLDRDNFPFWTLLHVTVSLRGR